jgi:glycerol-3-phosphate dehydrogenase
MTPDELQQAQAIQPEAFDVIVVGSGIQEVLIAW